MKITGFKINKATASNGATIPSGHIIELHNPFFADHPENGKMVIDFDVMTFADDKQSKPCANADGVERRKSVIVTEAEISSTPLPELIQSKYQAEVLEGVYSSSDIVAD